jgi:HEPN domain-containing protein
MTGKRGSNGARLYCGWPRRRPTSPVPEPCCLAIRLTSLPFQQAVEKALKALLVAAAQEVRRTHDIDALATSARAHWPQLLASPFPLAMVSQWYVTTRYPGLDGSPPTAAEVAEALAAVAGFVADVARLSPPDLAPSGGKEGESRR